MQGGRAGANNPILSEDMMMLRMGKKLRRKAKAEEADPFAPEFGTDSWFKTQQAANGGKVGQAGQGGGSGRRGGQRSFHSPAASYLPCSTKHFCVMHPQAQCLASNSIN